MRAARGVGECNTDRKTAAGMAAVVFCIGDRMLEHKKTNELIFVTSWEKRVLEAMRAIRTGEIRVVINADTPVRVEEIQKTVQL